MLIRQKFLLKIFCYFKLPIISYCKPKILTSNCTLVKIKIPLMRRTKNHLNSMYFGALAVGADFAAGLLVLNFFKQNKSKADLIFKDFKADFLKRANSDVIFLCKDSNIIQEKVLENIKTRKRVNFKIKVTAYCHEIKVANFQLTTSIK